ncbi:MAG: DUF2339 domain-containing protein [Candidatus Cohnella colombiensis]|uniref:DUF2339 domain-containing protein n=1 Tax=Candidatus Cohnella colombiensis TaxID=3121368 RepID=A0AA95EZG4_9BACL|nr:MAG: DUF2339 domain-containing protein [Cohnella sp.]
MDLFFRKHWTSLLGVMFILAAVVTLFKYSLDQGWITNVMKIGFGLISGAGLSMVGLALTKRGTFYSAVQILMGLGACILYATFSFAGIYYGLWNPMTVLIGMSAVTIGVSLFAYRTDSRLLMNIALAGGILSPLFMQPMDDQVFTLFLYLFVLNTAFFFLSIAKRWNELRYSAFIGTWIVYGVYYVHFDPPTEGLWNMPIRYALAAFIYYLVGFMLSSWKTKRSFDGWNVYLSLTNGVLFGCWAIFILQGELHYAFVLALIGFVYVIIGAIIYKLTQDLNMAFVSHTISGMMMLLLAIAQLGSGMEIKPLISVIVWGTIAGVVAVIGQKMDWIGLKIISVAIWFIVGIYWFIVTWDTPRGEWFGTYIPFLNWGAMAWVLLAVIGFYYSMHEMRSPKKPRSIDSDANEELLSNVFALFSHLIVGGLLTVQISGVFYEYFDSASNNMMQLSLSVSWGVYALLLFLWGAYRGQNLFRWFGTVVLLIVAVKAMFMDLSGQDMLYKVLVLILLGGISFLITWVNNKWNTTKVQSAEEVHTKN